MKIIMKIIKKIIKITLIIFVLGFIAVGIIETIRAKKYGVDITELNQSWSADFVGGSKGVEFRYTDLNWYDSIEEAWQDESLKEKDLFQGGFDNYTFAQSHKIIELELDEGQQIAIFYWKVDDYSNSKNEYDICYMLFNKEGKKISQPYRKWGDGFLAGFDLGYVYDSLDTVCWFLEQMAIRHHDGAYGIQAYYGVWDYKADVESLRICGIKPEIVEFEVEGKTWYMWYIADKADKEKIDKCMEEVNWGNYVYRDWIENFPITGQSSDER